MRQPPFLKAWHGPVFVAILVLFAIFAILFAFQIDPLAATAWSALASVVSGLITSILYGLGEGFATFERIRAQQRDFSEKRDRELIARFPTRWSADAPAVLPASQRGITFLVK